MGIWAAFRGTQQEKHLTTKTPDGFDLVFITGVALFEAYSYGDDDWGRQTVDNDDFVVGPTWKAISAGNVSASLALASVDGSDSDYDGWAIDNWAVQTQPAPGGTDRIKLIPSIAAKGEDKSHINRLSYSVTAIGQLA